MEYHGGVARGVALAVVAIQNHFASYPRSGSIYEEGKSQGGISSLGIN
jgi:hypothetical protein